jgi:hypothetical protein
MVQEGVAVVGGGGRGGGGSEFVGAGTGGVLARGPVRDQMQDQMRALVLES